MTPNLQIGGVRRPIATGTNRLGVTECLNKHLNLVSSVARRAHGERDQEAAAVVELDGSHQIIAEEGRGEAEVEGRCLTPDPCGTSMVVTRC
jgi:hypothetical protein